MRQLWPKHTGPQAHSHVQALGSKGSEFKANGNVYKVVESVGSRSSLAAQSGNGTSNSEISAFHSAKVGD